MNNKHLFSNNHIQPLMLSAIAGLCIAGTALAQQEAKAPERRVQGTFNEPLESHAWAHSEARGRNSSQHNTILMTVVEDDQTYSLKMINNEISAQVNGKEVPRERIRRKGDKIDILGENGKVLHTFKIDGMNVPVAPMPPMPPAPPSPPARGFAPAPRAFSGQELTPSAQAFAQNPPPVMIGMLMDYSDEQSGIVVRRVFEGMPAEKGGLKAGDVIVRIDGKVVSGIEVMRDVLGKKSHGDKLSLVIERDDKTKELALDLVKYNAEEMEKARGDDGDLMPLTGVENFRYEGMPDNWNSITSPQFKNDVKKALQQAMEQVQKSSLNEAEQWKGEVVSSLQKALELVESSSQRMQMQLREYQTLKGAQGGPTIVMQERPGQAFTITPAPKAPESSAQTNAQLERLANSLEKLNKRLEEMEKKLENK